MGAKKTLRELGLTDYETRVLLFLSSAGEEKTAKEIAKSADVPLTKLYSILLDLGKRGLVEKLPGEVNHYRSKGKQEIIHELREEKEKEIEQKREKLDQLLDNLNSNLEEKEEKRVPINYFSSDKKYWRAYNKEVSKLERGEVYQIINNSRWAVSFLPEEIRNNPGLESMIKGDIKKRLGQKFILHHMVNPEKLVQSTSEDLKEKEKIKRSLGQILFYYDQPKLKETHYITLAPEFRNILIAIIKNSTFIEFYSEKSTELRSAIQIKSKEVSQDFARWFDAYSEEKHDPEEDYNRFKQQILTRAKDLKGINPKEIERAIENIEPFYFL